MISFRNEEGFSILNYLIVAINNFFFLYDF